MVSEILDVLVCPVTKKIGSTQKKRKLRCASTFNITHVRVSCDKPTGQYDSSFPCLRSSVFVSSRRAQVARLGRRKLIIICTNPAESYIAGAYKMCHYGIAVTRQIRTPSTFIPIHLSTWPLGIGSGFAWSTSKSSKDINVAINPCEPVVE